MNRLAELECSGPTEYNLQNGVEQWFHEHQKRESGFVLSNAIFKFLKKNYALASCLNLQDGLAIQEKGVAVFHKLFADQRVFLWGSVVQELDGFLIVPYLYADVDGVNLDWVSVTAWSCGSDEPALRFSKSVMVADK